MLHMSQIKINMSQVQHIWDEVGENDSERDKMFLQLEQGCLEVYRHKVDHASHACAQLHQDLVNVEVELAALFASLGDPAVSQQVSFFALMSAASPYGPHVTKCRIKSRELLPCPYFLSECVAIVGCIL
jgi:protein regulator of cytokinesis 1